MAAKNIKNMDLQSLYLLSTPVKIILACLVAVVVVVVAYFAIFRDQLSTLENAKEQEQELKEKYNQKAIQAASLDNLKAEPNALRQSFDVLLKQLPTDAEIPNLIQELHQAGAKNGLRMDSVIPKSTVNDGPIQILPYDISISGKYNQINRFTRDIGDLSRIITLESLSVSNNDKSGSFTLAATANTYKARPANEVAAELAAKNKEGGDNESGNK